MLSESPIKLEQPELVTVDVTVREIYEALKKNGFEHIRESWTDGEGGCVLQQTAWNLDVVATHDNWQHVAEHYDDIEFPGWEHEDLESQYSDISNQVESAWSKYALDKQLNKWATPRTSKWYIPEWEVRVGVGSTIVHWNDRKEFNEKTKEWEYALPTYGDVAQMAYEILKPHFDKTVKLLKYEYPNKPAKINS